MDMLYDCWLAYGKDSSMQWTEKFLSRICVLSCGREISSAAKELERAYKRLTEKLPKGYPSLFREGALSFGKMKASVKAATK